MRIAVFGTGYVGLVTGACLAQTGNVVTCCDIDIDKVNILKQGCCPIHEPGLEELLGVNTKEKRLFFTTDLRDAIHKNKIIIIAVGTPPKENGELDLSAIQAVAELLGTAMNEEKIIIQKSTAPMGTSELIEELIQEKIAKRGLDIRFEVVSNPEFLKEGSAVNDFMSPDRIVIGTANEKAKKPLKQIYSPFMKREYKIIWTDRRSAELIKYAANAMLATKISFMNLIARISEAAGADIRKVRQGIGSDPRIGPDFLYPSGVGYGGSCFPKDIRSLSLLTKELLENKDLDLFGLVDSINRDQRTFFLEKVFQRFGQDLTGKTFGIWGLSFKANTNDTRESAAYYIVDELLRAGAEVRVYDPEATNEFRNNYGLHQRLTYTQSQYQAAAKTDAVIILTEWLQFRTPDPERMNKIMKQLIIFDARNLCDPEYMEKEGFEYYDIGRVQISSS